MTWGLPTIKKPTQKCYPRNSRASLPATIAIHVRARNAVKPTRRGSLIADGKRDEHSPQARARSTTSCWRRHDTTTPTPARRRLQLFLTKFVVVFFMLVEVVFCFQCAQGMISRRAWNASRHTWTCMQPTNHSHKQRFRSHIYTGAETKWFQKCTSFKVCTERGMLNVFYIARWLHAAIKGWHCTRELHKTLLSDRDEQRLMGGVHPTKKKTSDCATRWNNFLKWNANLNYEFVSVIFGFKTRILLSTLSIGLVYI